MITEIEEFSHETKDGNERFVIGENQLNLLFLVHLQKFVDEVNVEGGNIAFALQRFSATGTEFLNALLNVKCDLLSEPIISSFVVLIVQ